MQKMKCCFKLCSLLFRLCRFNNWSSIVQHLQLQFDKRSRVYLGVGQKQPWFVMIIDLCWHSFRPWLMGTLQRPNKLSPEIMDFGSRVQIRLLCVFVCMCVCMHISAQTVQNWCRQMAVYSRMPFCVGSTVRWSRAFLRSWSQYGMATLLMKRKISLTE